MLFEVWRDGKRMAWTEHESCIPSEGTQKAMKKAGCKIKYRADGGASTRHRGKEVQNDEVIISRGTRKRKGE